MPCEHYKNALVEAAACGVAPKGELRVHLDSCVSCRAAFAEEQSLFAAIDFGLHAAANEEVPTSLIPRVRAGLDEVAVAHPRWSTGWAAVAAAATVAVALLLTMRVHNNFDGLSARSAANLPAAPETIPGQIPSLPSPGEVGKLPRSPLVSAAMSGKLRKEIAVRKLAPEVLVPHDQEALLAGYVQQWSFRARAPLVANEVDDLSLEPLQVSPIQIPHLDVKPLAEEGSR